MMTRALLATALALVAACGTAAEHPIDTLGPGHWLEVPNSHMKSVAFKWPRGIRYSINSIGVRGVISLWSGGAYDTKRDRLVIWGGGHKGYAGNELYAFNVNILEWERLTDPSLKVNTRPTKPGRYVDGLPRSCHTYNYVQYVPAIDRFCSFGTAGGYPTGNDGTSVTWTFDFDKKKWKDQGEAGGRGIGAYSAVDPVTGRVFVRGNYPAARLAEWDPKTNKWTDRTGRVNHRTDYYKTAAIDPVGRRFFAIGKGRAYLYEFGQAGRIKQQIITTKGPQDLVKAACPGLTYDPVIDKVVGWTSGTSLWTLDLDTLTWAEAKPAATNKVTPSAPCPTGTYGRFRYMPSGNAYVVVNSWNTNVFVYRLSDLKTADVPKRFAEMLKRAHPLLVRWVAGRVKLYAREKAEPLLKAALAHHRARMKVTLGEAHAWTATAIEQAMKDLAAHKE